MRKVAVTLFFVFLMGIVNGCSSNYKWAMDAEEELEKIDLDSV